jgi:hypothetical protein
MLYPKIPLLWVVTWVSKQEIRLGGSSRTGVDAMETVTKRVKRSKNKAHIGISDLHPQVAKGDGRTLISIGISCAIISKIIAGIVLEIYTMPNLALSLLRPDCKLISTIYTWRINTGTN